MSDALPSPSTTSDVNQCKDLWYPDGTIILQAENQQFRVYGGLLAENSQVFSDMFAFPQPVSNGAATDSPPVVHLQDSKDDLYCFLKALHCTG
jgi:hypothetical protein